MTGIDELRRTLDDRATRVSDTDVVSRTAGVHYRIGVVRRRRRAAVAASAVAVLAVAAGVALLPESDGPDAADRTVVGVEAPAQMTSLDYTYGFDRVVEGDGGFAVVKLDASDEPRLVSWATSGDDDEVTVREFGAEPLTSTSADFSDFVFVPPGDTVVRVKAASGRVGLAVYELTDDRPEGITEDGITFRQQVENRTLIDAVVGERGDSDVSLDVATPAGGLGYAVYCVGAPAGALLRVGHGEGYVETSCNEAAFDPGLDAVEVEDLPAMDVPVRAWIVDREGRAVEDPAIRLGVGVYAVTPDPEASTRQLVPARLEVGGHRWRVDQITEGIAGDRTIRTRATGAGPQLAVLLTAGRFESARPVIDGTELGWLGIEMPSPTRWEIGQVSEGGEVSVSLHGAVDDDVLLTLVTYVRAD